MRTIRTPSRSRRLRSRSARRGKCPALIASRRVAFHLKAQRVLALEVSPGGLLRRRIGRHPPDADRRRHRSAKNRDGLRRHRRPPRAGGAARRTSTRSSGCRRTRPIVGAVGALTQEKGHIVPDRRRGARRPRSARRAVRDSRRRRSQAGARASDQRAASREARASARVPRGHPRVHQRASTSSSCARCQKVSARRCSTRWRRRKRPSPATPAAFLKSSSTARRDCSCRREIITRSRSAISDC